MEKENYAEAMRKQIFQIQKYDPVNWKLKWNINSSWEINSIGNTMAFLFPFNFEIFLRTFPVVAASLKFQIS